MDASRISNVVLTLTEDEATWLMYAMQNPTVAIDKEIPDSQRIRHSLFDSLKNALHIC